MLCTGYTKVWELAANEIVRLDGARGTTLRVTSGRLWITLENDKRDIVLSAGDSYTIDRGGLTLVEAQGASTVCVLAHHVEERARESSAPLPRHRRVAGLEVRARRHGRLFAVLLAARRPGRPASRREDAKPSRQPLANVISPPATPTLTVSPAACLPASNSFASGFSICCWIARFNGRAP